MVVTMLAGLTQDAFSHLMGSLCVQCLQQTTAISIYIALGYNNTTDKLLYAILENLYIFCDVLYDICE